MRTLIVYRSKYGTTRHCARLIAEGLTEAGSGRHEVTPIDLEEQRSVDLDSCDIVVIGGPVYGGLVHPDITRFCRKNRASLIKRDVALFICCLYTGDRAEAQTRSSFPAWLTLHAFTLHHLGGELKSESLNLRDRLLIRLLGLRAFSSSNLRDREIRKLVGRVRDRSRQTEP